MLRRGKIVIKNNKIRLVIANQRGQLFDLAFACESRCVGPLSTAFEHGHNLHICTVSQAHYLLGIFAVIGIPEVETHNDGAFNGARSIKHQRRI